MQDINREEELIEFTTRTIAGHVIEFHTTPVPAELEMEMEQTYTKGLSELGLPEMVITGMNEEIRIQRLLIMIEAAGSEAGLSIDQLVEVVPGNKKVVQRCQPTEEFDVLNNDTDPEDAEANHTYLQVLWSDAEAKFPGDVEYLQSTFPQFVYKRAATKSEKVDEVREIITQRIAENGYTMMGVLGDADGHRFCYSMTSRELHPELLCAIGMAAEGVPMAFLQTMVSDFMDRQLKGERFTVGQKYTLELTPEDGEAGSIVSTEILVIDVPMETLAVKFDMTFEGLPGLKPERMVQLVWMDGRGRFPTEEGYDHDNYPQHLI